MKTESLVRLLAGTVVLVGTLLAWKVSAWWLLMPAFSGLNLLQSVVTGFCPPTWLLRQLGWIDAKDVIHWGGRRG